VVRVELADDVRARLGSLKLVPGMPVEAFIKTGERRVISYLMKPLADQMQRALRED
jgi:HlyD family secretion protein